MRVLKIIVGVLIFYFASSIIYSNHKLLNHDLNRKLFMFIGRGEELQFLENKYKAKAGQLVVLYGRRRIGKTETLRQFCKEKPHVFFACQECSDKLQLKNFSAVTDLPYGDRKKPAKLVGREIKKCQCDDYPLRKRYELYREGAFARKESFVWPGDRHL